MEFNKKLLEILEVFKNNNYFIFDENLVSIDVNGDSLVKIDESFIVLDDKMSLDNKLSDSQTKIDTVEVDKAKLFFKKISDSIIKLNHLGVSYYVDDFDKEIEELKLQFKDTNFGVFEEESDNIYQKWIFIKHKKDDQAPMFEMVLNKKENKYVREWVPHFQIDVDTDLDIKSLEKIADETIRKGFLSWKLEFDNVGVVLAMGILGEVSGLKLGLGLGTNTRGEQILKELK